MEYKEFENVFNEVIFEKSKSVLISKIATYPHRYVGLFRPTKPKAKIIQNLLQSHEIRFGDAFEFIIKGYLKQRQFSILNGKFSGSDGKSLELDHVFSKNDNIYFAEQKIRDDHDSTKKRGQIDNFEKKIIVIQERYAKSKIDGFFYFIDDSFQKNKNYYASEIEQLSDSYGIPLHLSYGSGFFEQLGERDIWKEILKHLRLWKAGIPELPEINFDKDSKNSFDEIKNLSPQIYRKLFSNHELDGILCVLFPENKTLNLLSAHFEAKHQSDGRKIYQTLKNLCDDTINRLKSALDNN